MNEFIGNFFWRSLQILGKQGIFFLIFIMGARLLDQNDFGIYNYVIALVMMLTLFCDFGISKATSRHISMNREFNTDTPEEVVFNMSILIFILGLIIFVILFLFGGIFFKENLEYILYSSPLIILIPLNSIQEGLYIGLEKFKKLSIIIILSGVLSIVLSYFLIIRYGLVGMILSHVFFYGTSFLLLILFHGKISFKFKNDIIKNIGKYSVFIGISGLGYFLFSRIDILILGHYGYLREISNYEIINKLFAIITIPSIIFSSIISPRVALMFARNESKQIWNLYKRSILLALVTSFLIILFCYTFFDLFVGLVFPNYNIFELRKIFSILSILILSQMVTSVISSGFSISTGHAKMNMYFLLIFGIVLIPITLVAINKFNFEGVLYSTVIVKVVSDIFYIYKYTKIIKWKK